MKWPMAVVLFACVLFAAPLVRAEDLPPGSIKLLPGYHHITGRGIDSSVGKIWRDGGAIIKYDIGGDAGIHTDHGEWTKGTVWRTEQTINGQKAVIVFTKKKMLVISFLEMGANFYSTIRNDRDLADVLLMISTFAPYGCNGPAK